MGQILDKKQVEQLKKSLEEIVKGDYAKAYEIIATIIQESEKNEKKMIEELEEAAIRG